MNLDDLQRAFNLASERLQKLAARNAPFGTRQSAEQQYSQAYQALVRAGLAPQIRGKYR